MYPNSCLLFWLLPLPRDKFWERYYFSIRITYFFSEFEDNVYKILCRIYNFYANEHRLNTLDSVGGRGTRWPDASSPILILINLACFPFSFNRYLPPLVWTTGNLYRKESCYNWDNFQLPKLPTKENKKKNLLLLFYIINLFSRPFYITCVFIQWFWHESNHIWKFFFLNVFSYWLQHTFDGK